MHVDDFNIYLDWCIGLPIHHALLLHSNPPVPDVQSNCLGNMCRLESTLAQGRFRISYIGPSEMTMSGMATRPKQVDALIRLLALRGQVAAEAMQRRVRVGE